MNQMFKLCCVCNEYPPGPHGGIGTATQVLARALARSGRQVRVAGVCPSTYPGAQYEVDRGVRVWRCRMPSSRFRWILSRYRFFRVIARWSNAKEVDIVEVPDWQGWAAYWPRLRIPVVVRMHGCALFHTRERGAKPRGTSQILERACLHRADFLCAVSRYVADGTLAASGVKGRAVEVLQNFVEPPAGIPAWSGRSPARVVFAGTLTGNKGVIPLIDAWSSVQKECPAATLEIFGKDGRGPDGETSMRQHLEERLPPRARSSVSFHGHVTREELIEALSRARLGVFPSFSEACPMAPLEAMASGCPTVFTTLSCGPEIVRDGLDGLLVDPRRPEEIAEAIARLLKDEAFAERLGRAGKQRVEEHFSLERLLPKNVEFYQRCLAEFRRRK